MYIAQMIIKILQNNLCQIKERRRVIFNTSNSQVYFSKANISFYLLHIRLIYYIMIVEQYNFPISTFYFGVVIISYDRNFIKQVTIIAKNIIKIMNYYIIFYHNYFILLLSIYISCFSFVIIFFKR